QAAHGDGQRGVLALLGRRDHGVGDSDQLLFDRARLAHAGASPSGPSAVTMIECGRPSGPPSRPRISSVRAPPVPFVAIFWSWLRSLSLASLPPFSRAHASTTSSM